MNELDILTYREVQKRIISEIKDGDNISDSRANAVKVLTDYADYLTPAEIGLLFIMSVEIIRRFD